MLISILTTILLFNPPPLTVQTERQEVIKYLSEAGLKPNAKLQALACWQSGCMAHMGQINENDVNFKNFGQRLEIFKLDYRTNKFTEYYFRCYCVFKENFKAMLDETKQGCYTDYGVGVSKGNDGMFYITITVADYREYT